MDLSDNLHFSKLGMDNNNNNNSNNNNNPLALMGFEEFRCLGKFSFTIPLLNFDKYHSLEF